MVFLLYNIRTDPITLPCSLARAGNKYAASCRRLCSHSSPRPWHDVSIEEMKTFIGVLILMGVCRLPRLKLYWTTKYPYICPGICNIMSQVRFEQIFFDFYISVIQNSKLLLDNLVMIICIRLENCLIYFLPAFCLSTIPMKSSVLMRQ